MLHQAPLTCSAAISKQSMELKPGLSALVTGGASGIGNFLNSCFSFGALLVLVRDDFTVNEFNLLTVLLMACLNHVVE